MKRTSLFFSSLACALLAAAIPACDGDDDGTGGSGPGGTSTTTGTGGGGGSGGDGGAGGGTGGAGGGMMVWDLDRLMEGLEGPRRQDYQGTDDGGLAHLTYWTMAQDSPEYMALPMEEQEKVTRIQTSALGLASALYQPTAQIAGTEVTGTLVVQGQDGERRQRVVLKLPEQSLWNGGIVVAGTAGTRNEFSNDVILASWALELGYAYVSGDKGMENGEAALLSGEHPTQHWGDMLVDIGLWARERLEDATGQSVVGVYAMGLSNGGYQVRRGLEIDHLRAEAGEARLFDGGIDWSGAYWPDARVLDMDGDTQVTPAEYAQATHLVSSTDQAALALGWAHSPGTLTTPAGYVETPPFSAAHPEMLAAGFSAESAVIWGAYNTLFDAFKAANAMFQGLGYYNITSYSFRAELLGHTDVEAAAYSTYPAMPDQEPALYGWLASAADGGWTQESVDFALRNATTGVFSAPLFTLHGDRDGFLGLGAHALAYRDAVEAVGEPSLYRLYVIQNGTHVDRHADGALDYNFDGQAGEEGAGNQLTPMQGYVKRAFEYMVAWVEAGASPPDSGTVVTDPVNDTLEPVEFVVQ